MNATTTGESATWEKPRRERAAVEVPTLLLILATYGGWLAITFAYGRWSLAIVAPVTIVLLVLHSSLQHEILHGHPTRWRSLNRTFGIVPLSLWLSYERYRREHLAHHVNERLTDPIDDPETYYWTPERWRTMRALGRAQLRAQRTLFGRVVVGSFGQIARHLRAEFHALMRNDGDIRAVWLEHFVWCIPVIAWLTFVCGMPFWVYVVIMVIPANGILLIRSFAEHRARAKVSERTALVEKSWILGPLFLFNNLHSLHHEEPAIPWYAYHARYRIVRAQLIAENGGLVYQTYFHVAWRFLFRPHDVLVHPAGRVARAAEAEAQAGTS